MNLNRKSIVTLQGKNKVLVRVGMGALYGLVILSGILFTSKVFQSQSGRVTDGLIALYDFQEGSGSTVYDMSGVGAAMDLTIADTNKVSWLPDGGISIDQATIIESSGPASKIISAVKVSREITIEAWVRCADDDQDGPARIVTLSQDGYKRNFTLAQNKKEFRVRFRTTDTDDNGRPELKSPSETVNPSTLQHVVYTRAQNGAEKLFVDGKVVETDTKIGNLSNWNLTWRLGIANELTRDRDWLGEIRLVAVYEQALDEEDIQQNYRHGIDNYSYFDALSSFLPGETAAGWSTFDADSFEVETIGIGVHDQSGLQTLNIPDPAEVRYILIETISTSGDQYITYTTDLGSVSPGSKVIYWAGTTESPSFQVHRSYLKGGATVSSINIQASSSSRLQSITAMLFRRKAHPQSNSIGYFVQDWFYKNSKTYQIEIPQSNSIRDINITIPVTEMSNDNRFAFFSATAGSISDQDTISTYDPALGASLRMVQLSLIGVPGEVTVLEVKAESPASDGDSFAIGGAIEVSPAKDNSTFPVEWLDFSVKMDGEEASLNWSTASEMASDYFAIERSANGGTFDEVAALPAAGTSAVPQHYVFYDSEVRELNASKLLYRLRQVDMDGSFSFSKVIELNLGSEKNFRLNAYPNPVSDILHVEYNSSFNSPLQMQILNLSGQILKQEVLSALINEQGQLSIPVEGWAPGLYFINLSDETNRTQFKFVVR